MDTGYELYAVKYAQVDRRASGNFIGGDPHDGPMPLDFFVWLARSGNRTWVIDTGFNAATAQRRKRNLIRCPTEGLQLLGVDASSVQDVVITHLHYDHVGNFELFPAATYHLQDDEMRFATGRHMAQPAYRGAFDVEDVVGMVRGLMDRDTAPGAEPEDLMRCDLPAIIVPGSDNFHATSAARYLQECLPNARYWDMAPAGQSEEATRKELLEFLGSV